MDKSPVGLPSFITTYYGPKSSSSKAFQALIRGIGEATSKHEEERIIQDEFRLLKEKFSQPSSSKQMREYLVRLVFCEMLGMDGSDFHIHAINFAQQRNLMDKRIGYLSLSIFLHENHNLILLLINTLQRDVKSTNVLEVCYALTAISKLINTEMIPTILQQVLGLMDNKRDIIRKKAVMAVHTLYKKCPSMIPDIKERAIMALKDHDLSVAAASLHLLYDLILDDPSPYKSLVSLFVGLQTHIISGKLTQDFEFHQVAAPWVQIKNLKILALLGAYDKRTSKPMYTVLSNTLNALTTSSLIGYAVAYECTRTIISIYPKEKLIKQATKCIGLFLVAKSNNIKYLGMNALAALVEVKASFATEPAYQRIVIDCLDDPDETLRRKTLDLLCRITNADNVESICDRLTKYLQTTVDIYFRTDLVTRVTELAERYAPDNCWYILTMNEVLELGGDLVREEVAHNLMRIIAEGNEDEEVEEELRRFAVTSYMDLVEKPVLPDILVRVIGWVLGEYSYVLSELESECVMEKLCCLLEKNYSDSTTKRWLVTSLGKLVSQSNGAIPSTVREQLHRLSASDDMDTRQRCNEILELSQSPDVMQKVLPDDASCEDLEVDSELSFLDDFVAQTLQHGASAYIPEAERRRETTARKEIKTEDPKLILTPYEPPQRPSREPRTILHDTHSPKQPTTTLKTTPKPAKTKKKVLNNESAPKPLSGVKGPWGPKGYTKGPGKESATGSNLEESGTKSGSSSKNFGSSRVPKSKAESSPHSIVFAHEDKRKQRLTDDLFKGVGKPQLPGQIDTCGSGRPRRSSPRMRERNRDLLDNEKPPPPPPRKYLDKTETEIDLLLDLDTGHQVPPILPKLDEPEFEGLVTTQNKMAGVGNEMQEIKNIDNTDFNSEQLTVISETPDQTTPLIVSDIAYHSEGISERNQKDLLVENEIDGHESMLTECLIDADISEPVNPLDLDEQAATSARMPDELREFPRSLDNQELCGDTNIRVLLHKVYKPDQLVLVIYLTNQSQGNLLVSNVVTNIEPPSNLRASFDSSTDNRFVDDVIEPLSSVTHCVSLTYKSPALHMGLGGKVTYKDSTSAQRTLFISTVLPLRDILRPYRIDTDTFGAKWGETPFEKRQTISSRVTSCGEFLSRVEERLGLHAIENIGSKVIAAGTVLQGPVCLLHGMVSSDGTLDVRIKTSSQLLSDAVVRQCAVIFR